jgi:hypothetical protein
LKRNVMIARFPYQNAEVPDIADWLVPTVLEMKKDPSIGEIGHCRVDDTPITMTRNRVLKQALDLGFDHVLMLDSDMRPDLYPAMPGFWKEAWSFARQHQGPCLIAAPYCGPPPDECVYVFQWTRRQEGNPNPDFHLQLFTREQAALKKGIEEVAALPTGLILIDLRVCSRVKPPWFRYEWTDVYEQQKASTEDVYFTRNCSLSGIPVYVTWDAWAGHWKRKLVERPTVLTSATISDVMEDAILRRRHPERLEKRTNGPVEPRPTPLIVERL